MNTMLGGELCSVRCGTGSPQELGKILIPGDQGLELMQFMEPGIAGLFGAGLKGSGHGSTLEVIIILVSLTLYSVGF